MGNSVGNSNTFVQPIRTPGSVQGFGVLIAVEQVEDTFIVRQVSEVWHGLSILCIFLIQSCRIRPKS